MVSNQLHLTLLCSNYLNLRRHLYASKFWSSSILIAIFFLHRILIFFFFSSFYYKSLCNASFSSQLSFSSVSVQDQINNNNMPSCRNCLQPSEEEQYAAIASGTAQLSPRRQKSPPNPLAEIPVENQNMNKPTNNKLQSKKKIAKKKQKKQNKKKISYPKKKQPFLNVWMIVVISLLTIISLL